MSYQLKKRLQKMRDHMVPSMQTEMEDFVHSVQDGDWDNLEVLKATDERSFESGSSGNCTFCPEDF